MIQNTNVGVQYIVLIMLCCELCWHLNLNQFVAFASKYGFGNYVTDVESAVWQCFSDFILICVCKSVFMHFFTLSMIVFCRLFGVLNDNDDDDDDDDDDKKTSRHSGSPYLRNSLPGTRECQHFVIYT